MQNVELLETKLQNSDDTGNLKRIYDPDGKSCLLIAEDEHIVINTVSGVIKALFHIVHKTGRKITRIVIVFKGRNFDDKLTYVLLEWYLEHVITVHKLTIKIFWNNNTSIFTHGMVNSPLQKLCTVNDSDQNDYSTSLNKSIGKTHYRRVFLIQKKSLTTHYRLFSQILALFLNSSTFRQSKQIR